MLVLDCANSIFCETLGELKCTVLQRRVNYEDCNAKCEHFKKAKSNKPEDHPCHCRLCMNEDSESYKVLFEQGKSPSSWWKKD